MAQPRAQPALKKVQWVANPNDPPMRQSLSSSILRRHSDRIGVHVPIPDTCPLLKNAKQTKIAYRLKEDITDHQKIAPFPVRGKTKVPVPCYGFGKIVGDGQRHGGKLWCHTAANPESRLREHTTSYAAFVDSSGVGTHSAPKMNKTLGNELFGSRVPADAPLKKWYTKWADSVVSPTPPAFAGGPFAEANMSWLFETGHWKDAKKNSTSSKKTLTLAQSRSKSRKLLRTGPSRSPSPTKGKGRASPARGPSIGREERFRGQAGHVPLQARKAAW